MTRSEMVEQLKNEYRRRRMQAEQEQDARVREVERADPQIHALWAKQARLLNDAVRAMVARTPDAQEKAARMREEGQAVLLGEQFLLRQVAHKGHDLLTGLVQLLL